MSGTETSFTVPHRHTMRETEYIDQTRHIPTPALVIDGAAVRRNIERLAGYAAEVGLRVRPHTKTHKMRSLARMQLVAGAIGLTAAKVSEAAAISDAEQEVLLAYPPIGPERARRLAELARDRTVRAVVDSMTGVEMISESASTQKTAVGLLVELDVGMGRMGVPSPEATVPLAQAIDSAPHVRLDGIMVYPGHIWEKVEKQEAPLAAVNEMLAEAIALWAKHGLAATIVSGGSTPTAYQSHFVTRLTEIRPGTYVFNDMNTVHGGFCTMDDCAARVHATVISDAVAGQIVIDAGSKSLSSDRCLPAMESGFGWIVELGGARITRLSEEHGQIDVTKCSKPPRVGERLTVIPNHICPCLNLQESIWWVESDKRPRQIPVDARGMIQ